MSGMTREFALDLKRQMATTAEQSRKVIVATEAAVTQLQDNVTDAMSRLDSDLQARMVTFDGRISGRVNSACAELDAKISESERRAIAVMNAFASMRFIDRVRWAFTGKTKTA